MKKKEVDLDRRFARLLLKWNKEKNTRQMPWKGEKDPYRIWLSEIILQQTRVEQGLAYYNNFIKTFPTVHRLAAAPDKKVLKLWEGLGYYTRCRNLVATARYISKDLEGKFPSVYEEIRSLKGIGPYTAAAISSFAFNLPHAVVDGNVFRVLARIFGIDTAVDSTKGKKLFTELANRLLDQKQPGLYNQAIMDFGAVICKPAAPLCLGCVFQEDCFAFQHDRVNELPVKEKKISIKKRWFSYLVLEHGNSVAIRHRNNKDIWQGLYEFPLLEFKKAPGVKTILQQAEKDQWLPKGKYKIIAASTVYKQQLTHQLITARFVKVRLEKKPPKEKDWSWVTKAKAVKYPFPRLINQFIADEKI